MVEDDARLRRVTVRQLAALGYRVIKAENAAIGVFGNVTGPLYPKTRCHRARYDPFISPRSLRSDVFQPSRGNADAYCHNNAQATSMHVG